MFRALEIAIIAFWFLFTAKVIWTVWLKNYLIKEGIIKDGSKTKQPIEPPTNGE